MESQNTGGKSVSRQLECKPLGNGHTRVSGGGPAMAMRVEPPWVALGARNVPSENLSHHQSHVHGGPPTAAALQPQWGWLHPGEDICPCLKLQRKCFTITPSQEESQVNLSNNLKLGNVPLFYRAVFCFEFLHLPSLSPGSLVSGQVCPVFQGTHRLGGEFEPREN